MKKQLNIIIYKYQFAAIFEFVYKGVGSTCSYRMYPSPRRGRIRTFPETKGIYTNIYQYMHRQNIK